MGKVIKVSSKTSNDSILRETVEKAQKRIRKKAIGKANRQKAKQAEKAKKEVSQRNQEKRKEFQKQRRENYKKELGVLLVSHIPHGFYEEEIQKFFSQFGRVTRVRVVRSTISGRSKGHAFVVFRFKEVAHIAAETTNNYLMGKRILKVKVIPPEEVKSHWFYHKTPSDINLTLATKRRQKEIKSINRRLTPAEGIKRLKTQKKTIEKMLKKLKEKGIDFKCNGF